MYLLISYDNQLFSYYILYLKEFDSSSDYWYNQVVLTQLNNSISMNDEIKNKFLTSPYESAQQRLQRKISKMIFVMYMCSLFNIIFLY